MRTTEYETLPENNGKENVVRRESPTSQETDFLEHKTMKKKFLVSRQRNKSVNLKIEHNKKIRFYISYFYMNVKNNV